MHVYVLSVRPVSQIRRQLKHKNLILVVLFKARSGRLWTDAETLNESFDFPDGKSLYIASLLAWLKFPPLGRDNLQDRIFLKGINHWLLVFFLHIFIFFKKMYSQKDETCALRGSRKRFFSLPNHGRKIFKEFFKIFLRGSYNSVVYLCKFLEKKIYKFLFLALSGILKISERK